MISMRLRPRAVLALAIAGTLAVGCSGPCNAATAPLATPNADDRFDPRPDADLQAVDRMVLIACKQGLRRANVKWEIAKGEILDAGSWENPELRLGRPFPDNTNGNDPTIETALRWEPPKPGVSRDERAIAGASAGIAGADVDAARHALALRVRTEYANVLFQQRLVAVSERRVTNEQARMKAQDALAALGTGTILERNSAALRVFEAQEELDKLRSTSADSLGILSASVSGPVPPALSMPVVGLPVDVVGKQQDAARTHRPEIKRAMHALRKAQATRSLNERATTPWLSFGEISCDRLENGENDYGVRIGIEIPLFERKSGARQANRHAVAFAAEDVKIVDQQVIQEADLARSNLDQARAAERDYRKRHDEMMEQIRQSVAGLEANGGDQIATLGLEDERLRLERGLIEKTWATLNAELALHHALGLGWLPAPAKISKPGER
jgi:outer membrane protein TolC